MPANANPENTPQRFAIVAAQFNDEIVEKLLVGAMHEFKSQKFDATSVEVLRVPGSFELPLIAKTLAETGQYSSIICLGAVIRGDTDHYEYVCRAAADGILQVGLETGVPIIFGVLTCETEQQALDRAGGAEGNKGADAARAAIEMASLCNRIKRPI